MVHETGAQVARSLPSWFAFTCPCDLTMETPDPAQRLCPECYEKMLEERAHRIDPTYDPAQRHTWEECRAALARVYHFPMIDTGADDPRECDPKVRALFHSLARDLRARK
jgi:hypothetical protein